MLLAALVSTALTVSAQKAPVNFNGTIVDAFTRQAIKGEVTVSLLRPDSTMVMTTKSYEHTDRGNGTIRTFFQFDVPQQPDGHFLVKLEAKGYETVYKATKLAWKSKTIEVSLWNVPMRRTSRATDEVQLNEVTVTATKVKFYTKGDTLVYNADAFQLQEGSMLDALVAQLPGAELKPDGRIMVNGKFVESLLLNGRDFFKGDNTVLLDNLPAYMVQQVKVYTEESETSKLLGRKVDDGRFVMDVRLKRRYAIGWLANAEAGYGTKNRYLGRLFAMRYTPQSRLSLFGNANNINESRHPGEDGKWVIDRYQQHYVPSTPQLALSGGLAWNYDYWFVGFTPKYSAALWIGTDHNTAMSSSSASAALLWSRIMSQVPDVTEGEYPPQPADVVRVYGEYYTTATQP